MKKTNFYNEKAYNKYDSLALPFQRRLYRTALILTKSPHLAKELVNKTNLNASKQYSQFELGIDFDFGAWLFQLLMNGYLSLGKI